MTQEEMLEATEFCKRCFQKLKNRETLSDEERKKFRATLYRLAADVDIGGNPRAIGCESGREIAELSARFEGLTLEEYGPRTVVQ